MSKEKQREILFGFSEGDVTVGMMGHWNNDSGCMPNQETEEE